MRKYLVKVLINVIQDLILKLWFQLLKENCILDVDSIVFELLLEEVSDA